MGSFDLSTPHTLAMPTLSIPEDKPKLMFTAFMMFVQNFGFFLMYFLIWMEIPLHDDCEDLRFWVGCFALDCFVESFVCVWMAMAGYTDDQNFPYFWILHLLVALPYVLCTITIPLSIYADSGVTCRNAGSARMYPLVAVFWTHCGLFNVYVWMMLSVTYWSFVKPTFAPFGGEKVEAPSAGTVIAVRSSPSPTVPDA